MSKNGSEITKLVAGIIIVVGLAIVVGAALGWRFPYQSQRSANRSNVLSESSSNPTTSPTPVTEETPTPSPSPSPAERALPSIAQPSESEPVSGFW